MFRIQLIIHDLLINLNYLLMKEKRGKICKKGCADILKKKPDLIGVLKKGEKRGEQNGCSQKLTGVR